MRRIEARGIRNFTIHFFFMLKYYCRVPVLSSLLTTFPL